MILAIDVGGTKTLLATFNDIGEKTEEFKFPTPKEYPEFTAELEKAVKGLKTKDFKTCVMALPGRINREEGIGIAFGNLPWKEVPVKADLAKFMSCPIFIENDAKLAGLSEANEVLDKYRRTLYLTVSTGIGCGIIVDGKIDPDLRDAEVGHMLLEHGDRLMRWEEFASGKAIVARTGKRAADIPEGDPEWYAIARNIAIGLIDVITNLTPDCVIIGGGVGSHLDKFKDRLVESLTLYEDDLFKVPPILKAKRAEEAVIYGAYIYAKQNN